MSILPSKMDELAIPALKIRQLLFGMIFATVKKINSLKGGNVKIRRKR